ncbi:helix-turn-helix domain-containing protein [Providencia hangzhouensis]
MFVENVDKIKSEVKYINGLDITKETGKFLKSARIEKCLSGTEVGKLLYLSQQQVSRYENGLCNISIYMLNNYLHALGKDWSDYYYYVIGTNSSNKI